MLFIKSKSKFVYQTRTAKYLKFACILAVILLPLAALQIFLAHSNNHHSNHEAHQFLASPTSQLSIANVNKTESESSFNRQSTEGRLTPEAYSGAGEFFDVNLSVNWLNKSVLRVRRDIPESHGEASLSTNQFFTNSPSPVTETQVQDGTNAEANNSQDGINAEANNSQDGTNAEVNNPQYNTQTGSPVEADKKTLVSVTSKSGRFDGAVLPLDDLIVTAVDTNTQEADIIPATNAHVFHESTEDRAGQESADSSQPNVADMVAANSKTGFVLGDLAAQTVFNAAYNPNAGIDPSFGGGFGVQQNHYAKELPIYQQLVQSEQALVQPQVQKQEVTEEVEDGMPDSMESLMNSEFNDEPNERQDPSASSLIQSENGDTPNDVEDDEGDEAEEKADAPTPNLQQQAMLLKQALPIQYPMVPSLDPNIYGSPQAANIIHSEHMLNGPMRDTVNDLNVAAGHYYGKKKKKKKKVVVVKKKKKKVIVKKKKIKKKKVKVVKYKVKKIKVKKVKKKKKKTHHDHGKYYMYAKVPKKKAWEFGFKKGNKKHWIERHEKGHKNKFKTKVKWYDKKSKGKGVHIWDYNHHDKKKKKHY